MAPLVVGVHIFKKNEATAVDNYFIYLTTDMSESLSDVLKSLKTKHKFTDRTTKHGIMCYDIELCVYEKTKKRMITIDNQQGWLYAIELALWISLLYFLKETHFLRTTTFFKICRTTKNETRKT